MIAMTRSLARAPSRRSQRGRLINWARAALVAACVGLASTFGSVQAQDLQSLPEVRAPVVDTTGSLSADQIGRLVAELRAFEQKKGSQISIVFVSTTQPEAIEQYSMRLAEQVKAGRSKVDDGVLILVVVTDRKTRIEVGYGLEGAIPDIVANQIRREVMNPYFRNNDFYGGVRAGAGALMKRIEGESLPPAWQPDSKGAEDSDQTGWIVPAVLLILAFGGILRKIFGRLAASGVVAGAAGVGAWLVTSVAAIGGIVGVVAFVFSLLVLGRVFDFRSGRAGSWSAGSGGGSWSGGGLSGRDWSGGGGSFGGGGASGSWDD